MSDLAELRNPVGGRLAIEKAGNGNPVISVFGERDELEEYFGLADLPLAKRRELAKALLNGEPLEPPAKYRYVAVTYTPSSSIVSAVFGRERLFGVLDRETGEVASFAMLRQMAEEQAIELNAKPDRRRWIMFMPAEAAKDVAEL